MEHTTLKKLRRVLEELIELLHVLERFTIKMALYVILVIGLVALVHAHC